MKKSANQTRLLLLVGFGGLLLLLAFTGLNALSVLATIQTRNERIRQDYINRDRILEQLRSDIYLSGTFVRDFLLDTDPALADAHKADFESARSRIQANVKAYGQILRREERAPFIQLTNQLAAYFDSLRPALQWNARQRQVYGYDFMRNSLLPRRTVIVQLADRISDLNAKQLEAGSQQVVGLFATFRRSLVVLLVLTLFGGLVLAGGSIYRILHLERLSAMRFEEVEQARAALRDLSARLIDVQESERRALSRELHDEVGQSLSALLLGLGNVAAMLASGSVSEGGEHLGELRRLAERTVAVVRDMSLLLRPSMLDDLGLIPALQWQAREASRTKNLRVQVHADSIPEDLPDEYKTCIYRVVQEALRNTTRHARAKHVEIRLVEGDHSLQLSIRDDGQGFAPATEKGIGLLGMEERVAHLEGSFHVESALGEGTLIRVELPLPAKRERAAV